MRIEDLVVGQTYAGKSGKPRILSKKLYGLGSEFPNREYGNVEYHYGDPAKTHTCWCYTFAGWVREKTTPPYTELLEKVIQFVTNNGSPYTAGRLREWLEAEGHLDPKAVDDGSS